MNTYCGVSAWQWQSGSDYLAHHGIRGQKWGRKNGPPYPLSAGAHSAAEKRLKSKNEGKLESWKAKERAKGSRDTNRDFNTVRAREEINSIYEKRSRTFPGFAGNIFTKRQSLTKKEKEKVENYYLNKLTLKEASTIVALTKACDKSNDDTDKEWASYLDSFINNTDSKVKKWLNDTSDEPELQYKLMQKKRPNAKLERLGNKAWEDQVRLEEYVRSTLKRIMSDEKHIDTVVGEGDTPYRIAERTIGNAEKVQKAISRKDGILDRSIFNKMKSNSSYAKTSRDSANYVRNNHPEVARRAKALRKQGLTYYEIADRLGVNDGTVYALINEKG